ncbi:hypothetical protein EMIHUDRAFT_230380 [Emiliania huxleyi CCMP1516]|uniref:CCHC-type domain-containing protein n=2 Tax=Emiliania huxleyi TaxID=2903 RepID=A0A0D3KAK4_EMIH1|nr:hypothetical protein EMIHUDRAFT_230380 [Emiliania huxleyi CCMP1516]EOD32789.1 hypothetical protein EMIHUDRAFT_230380 [Emiliania huxleyi CCMP1516]|eukprot:XP_005785218.1 hypothetical protein EMIHUDRAFT_230380 [Emiliania huxleyi CCMP1516]
MRARQAIAVSELSSKLAAFRKDRGVETQGLAVTHSVRIDIPEVAEANRFNPEGGFERNWVAILIGKEGINKRRFEAETGATLYLRGKGTRLRHDGPKEIKKAGRGQYRVEDKEDAEPMHVLLEADTEEKLSRLGILEPKGESTSLALYDDTQLTKLAMAKTEGHHHSVCPNRRTTFQMAGVRCSVCGSAGHSARDCKGDRSGAVKLVPTSAAPSTLADADYAAFLSELDSRTTR